MTTKSYPSDLSDGAWKVVEPHLTSLLPAYTRRTSLRAVLDALAYRLRTGCQWRYLPHDFPPYRTVFAYFRQWSRTGVLDEVNLLIVRHSRTTEPGPGGRPRAAEPTAVVVDAQSVKSTVRGERDARGFDGNKRVNGRKRHVACDTDGRVLACLVEPGHSHEGPLLREVLIALRLDGLAVGCTVFADDGYRGQERAAALEGYRLEVVKRTDYVAHEKLTPRPFVPLPKRWVIEQAFGCLSQMRGLRLSHERRSRHAEAAFLLGNTLRLLARLKA